MSICLHPIYVNNMWVPCQQCPVCRSQIRGDLSLRIFYEQAYSGYSGYFVTLTYAPEYLPLCEGLPAFEKKDCQDFIRDLRYRLGKLRFFLTCEYGEEKKRSHYHAVILTEKHYSFNKMKEICDLVWSKGRTQVRNLTIERIQYATSYALKDEEEYLIKWKEYGLDSSQPFRLFSRNPGLGSLALAKVEELVTSDPSGEVKHSLLMEGKRMRIPRYFKDRFSEDVKAKYQDHENEGFYKYQAKLEHSRQVHSKYITINSDFGRTMSAIRTNDYSYDKEILKKRHDLKKERKKSLYLPEELK